MSSRSGHGRIPGSARGPLSRRPRAATKLASRPVVLALLLGFGLAGTATATATAGRTAIRWHACGGHGPLMLRCGELAVPLDYRHPHGATIRLGFNRLRALDREHRIGSLIVNPGGPGGAGSDVVAAEAAGGRLWHRALRRRFDLIGMDPRGVGRSTRVRCDPDVYNRRPSLFPRTPAELATLTSYTRALARSCRKRTGPLLAHVDTASVARDMEALRRALGDGKLNFLGLSYGAEIGTLYAERYPGRIRAMALDGILDHSIGSRSLLADNAVAYEDTFNRFAAWCGRSAGCALHGRDVAALFDELAERADRRPVAVPECATAPCRTPVTGDDIRTNAYGLLLFKRPLPALGLPGWNGLARALAALEAGDAGAFAAARLTSPGDATFAGLAVGCADYPPLIRGFGDLTATTRLARGLAPHTRGAGEAWTSLVHCLHRRAAVANPPHPARIDGAPPILLVSSTHDPSTPYRWARNLHRQIPRAVLLTRDGDGHTSSFLHRSRTNDAIARYLITKKAPPPNTVYRD